MLVKSAYALLALSALIVLILAAAWFAATQPFVEAGERRATQASASRLEQHVRMLSETLPARSDDVDDLNVAAAYVHDELAHFGEPAYQTFEVWGVPYRNVVLRLGAGADRYVTVGAHYDAFGGLPGADDNASGVAGLLELARLVVEDPPPGLAVELVAYALEEPPYFGTGDMGSFHHARDSSAEATIVLEMIGYFDDAPGSQRYPLAFLRHFYPDRGNFIALLGRFQEMGLVRRLKGAFLGASDLPVHSLTFLPVVPGVSLSDHRNYWLHGQRAVMVTDTAFMRNPHYHTARDRPETLDYERMAKVVEGVHGSLFAVAR